MAKKYPRYDRKRNRWTKSEMLSFLHPSTEEGAAAALAAAQEHYGKSRVIEMIADGHPSKDPSQTFYKPRLRAANFV